MFKRVTTLLVWYLPMLQLAPCAEDVRVSQWLPPDTALVVEVSRPLALLDPLLRPEFGKTVNAILAEQKPNPKFQQFQAIINILEVQLGTDWRGGLKQLLGGGLSLAVEPSGGVMLAADARDEKLLQKLHELIKNFAALDASKKGQFGSREYHGATIWTVGANEAYAMLGPRLLVANQTQLLERALDLRAQSGKSLAESPGYQTARKALGRETVATVYLNLELLKQNPKLKKFLADEGNPLGTLLLADTKAALRNSKWLAAGISVNGDKLGFSLQTDGVAPTSSKLASFASPAASGLLPNLSVPGSIASLSLYRDLRAFYAAKDELFPERTSGLVFFENMMGIFFSGIELTDGVLGETRPDLRVVVAKPRYDSVIGTPVPQIPAFAAILRLEHPQEFGPVVEEAWQKALGLANFTRGQKALPGLVIDRASHAEVKYTVSYYRPPTSHTNGPVDGRFNYRPSLARPGDYLVISSTDGLAEDLIDALKQEGAGHAKGTGAAHSAAEIDGSNLRGILVANQETLIRNNMVEKGNTREKAESDIDILLTALDCLERANLTLAREKGRPRADLELRLKMPTAKSVKTAALH